MRDRCDGNGRPGVPRVGVSRANCRTPGCLPRSASHASWEASCKEAKVAAESGRIRACIQQPDILEVNSPANAQKGIRSWRGRGCLLLLFPFLLPPRELFFQTGDKKKINDAGGGGGRTKNSKGPPGSVYYFFVCFLIWWKIPHYSSWLSPDMHRKPN